MNVHNSIWALNAQRMLMMNQTSVARSLEQLSSGLRINRAADDAAGLAISQRMRADTMTFSMAARNAQDGISLIRTAEGALNETHAMLGRMTELATQASSGILSDQQREALDFEFQALGSEINRIASATNFNGRPLLDGSLADGLNLQIGNTAEAHNRVNVSINDMSTAGLGLENLSIATLESAQGALSSIRDAVNIVSTQRGSLGAMENRQEHTINSLGVTIENLTAAESRIRDTNMALEIMNFTRNSILMQSSQAMLSQSMIQAGGVLNLLR